MRPRFSPVVGFFLACGFVVGCRENPVGPLPTTLVTDAASYIAAVGDPSGAARHHSFTVIARFTNTSRHTVHLSRCFHDTPYPIYYIDTVNRIPEAAYSPGWGCVGGHYFDVAPGASRVDTLPITAPWAFDGRTGEPFGVFEGGFVLIYPMYACLDGTPECREPLHELARSGVFTVTRAK